MRWRIAFTIRGIIDCGWKSKQRRNAMVNRPRISKWNRNFRNSGEMRRRVAFEIRSEFEFSKQRRNEMANRLRNSKHYRLWMKVETAAKCDGEPPSNFEVKSKFSKQRWNETASYLRNTKWNRNFRNSGEMRRRIAFKDRDKNEYITNFEAVAHFAVASPSKCEISCEIFPTG